VVRPVASCYTDYTIQYRESNKSLSTTSKEAGSDKAEERTGNWRTWSGVGHPEGGHHQDDFQGVRRSWTLPKNGLCGEGGFPLLCSSRPIPIRGIIPGRRQIGADLVEICSGCRRKLLNCPRVGAQTCVTRGGIQFRLTGKRGMKTTGNENNLVNNVSHSCQPVLPY
jgi:hypothetical protein